MFFDTYSLAFRLFVALWSFEDFFQGTVAQSKYNTVNSEFLNSEWGLVHTSS